METKLGDLLKPSQSVGSVELEVTEDSFKADQTDTSLLKGLSRAEFGELRQALLGKRATISIASPDPNAVSLSMEGNRERVLVPLLCTFDPDPSVHFNYARIDGQLVASGDKAVAEEMFPAEVTSTVQVSRELKLSPKFTFHKVEFEAVELSAKKDYILYEPEILALHLSTPKPAWSLRSTSSKSVAGIKYLFLVVNKPAGKAAHLEISAGGGVQTNVGPIPVAWAKRDRVASLVIKI